MALINFILTSITALLSSFLSLPPSSIFTHGLAPWVDTLSTGPVAPMPAALPKAFFTPDVWGAIPTFDSGSAPSAPPPTPTSCCSDEKDEKVEEEFFAGPPPKEPTSDEPLSEGPFHELWRLLKQALLRVSLDTSEFIRNHPYLPLSPSFPTSSADWGCQPPIVQDSSPMPWESFANQPRQLTVVEHLRRKFHQLQDELNNVNGQLEEMRRQGLARASAAPTTDVPSPQPPKLPLGQPVISTGTAPPSTLSPPAAVVTAGLPLPQTPTLPLGQPVISTGTAPPSALPPPPAAVITGLPLPPGQPVFSTGTAPALPSFQNLDFGLRPPPPGQPVFGTGSAPLSTSMENFDFGFHPPPHRLLLPHPHRSFSLGRPPPAEAFNFKCPPAATPPSHTQADPEKFSLDSFLKDHPKAGNNKPS